MAGTATSEGATGEPCPGRAAYPRAINLVALGMRFAISHLSHRLKPKTHCAN